VSAFLISQTTQLARSSGTRVPNTNRDRARSLVLSGVGAKMRIVSDTTARAVRCVK